MPADARQHVVTINAMPTDGHYNSIGAGTATAVAGFVPTQATVTTTTTSAIPATTSQCLTTRPGDCPGCRSSACSCSDTAAVYNRYSSSLWDPQNTAPVPVPGPTPASAHSTAAAGAFVVGWNRDCGVLGVDVERTNFPPAGDQLVTHNDTSHHQLDHPGGGSGGDVFGGGENFDQNQLDSEFPAGCVGGFPQQHGRQDPQQSQPHSQHFWSDPAHSADTNGEPVPHGVGTSSSAMPVAAPGYPSSQQEGLVSSQQQQQQAQAYDGMAHHYQNHHHGHRPNTMMMMMMMMTPDLGVDYHNVDTRQQGNESFVTYQPNRHQHSMMTETDSMMNLHTDMDMATEIERQKAGSNRKQQHNNFNIIGEMPMMPDYQDPENRRPSYTMSTSMSSGASSTAGIRMDSLSRQSSSTSQSVAMSLSGNMNMNMNTDIVSQTPPMPNQMPPSSWQQHRQHNEQQREMEQEQAQQQYNPRALEVALALQPEDLRKNKGMAKNTRQQMERVIPRAMKPGDGENQNQKQRERANDGNRKEKGYAFEAGLDLDGSAMEVDGGDMDGEPEYSEEKEYGEERREGDGDVGLRKKERGREESQKKPTENKLTRAVSQGYGMVRLGAGDDGRPRTTLSTLSSVQPYLTPAISPPGPGPGPGLGSGSGLPHQQFSFQSSPYLQRYRFPNNKGGSFSLNPPPSSSSLTLPGVLTTPPLTATAMASQHNNPPAPAATRDQRNRAAANRYRNKSKAAVATLQMLELELSQRRQELLSTLKSLEQEKYELKTAMLRHVSCDCRLIREYLEGEAMKILMMGREQREREEREREQQASSQSHSQGGRGQGQVGEMGEREGKEGEGEDDNMEVNRMVDGESMEEGEEEEGVRVNPERVR